MTDDNHVCIFLDLLHTLSVKGWCTMDSNKNLNIPIIPPTGNLYDDGNIPDVDLPSGEDAVKITEPLPESSRPRKDGPGGE